MNKYIKEPKGKHYTPQGSLYLQCWCMSCILSVYNVEDMFALDSNVYACWVNTECPDCSARLCTRVSNHADMCGVYRRPHE